ncbi:cw7 protein, putative [Ricinus communis]|uniref:Cw7 protein, putative n=1 Tax=Ricinus communis TaxID=3988 RepID=B9TMB1_RICCO|nr:cw7 protein, putative [Ricinus communis]
MLNIGFNLSDQSQQDFGPFSPVTSKRGFGIGSIVRKAASVASVAAKHAYAAAAASTSSDEEMVPLKCCLMAVSLPWEHIAYDLLFKGTVCILSVALAANQPLLVLSPVSAYECA